MAAEIIADFAKSAIISTSHDTRATGKCSVLRPGMRRGRRGPCTTERGSPGSARRGSRCGWLGLSSITLSRPPAQALSPSLLPVDFRSHHTGQKPTSTKAPSALLGKRNENGRRNRGRDCDLVLRGRGRPSSVPHHQGELPMWNVAPYAPHFANNVCSFQTRRFPPPPFGLTFAHR